MWPSRPRLGVGEAASSIHSRGRLCHFEQAWFSDAALAELIDSDHHGRLAQFAIREI